jgi:protein N-terminal amidase
MGGRSSRAYDGQVSIQQQKEILTPTTAFDEMTPNSPNRFFWIPSDTLLKTPMEPRTWTPARADSPTLSMKVPETSQAYTKNTAARSQPVEYQSIGRASPAQLRSISKSRAESKSSGQPIEPQAITRCAFEPSESSLTPAKNVTHTKSTDRSDSPFADRPDWAAIAQRLDALSSRPESAAVNKTDSFSPRPGSNLARRVEGNDKSPNAMPSRPSSPKSRNASRSRAANPVSVDDPLGDQRQESISRASIRIGANANVLDNKPARGPSAMCRPNSRMTNVEPSHRPMSKPRHSRSNSVSVGYVAHTTDLEDGNGGRPPSRAASRGRQRAPKPNDGIEAQHERSDSPRVNPRDCSVPVRRPSAPSFRFRSPAEFEAEMKRISPECSVQAYYGDTGNGDENEIIGEIIVRRSPSCAVHGRKTQATSPRGNDSKTPESTSSRRVDGYRQNATPLKATEVEDTNASLIKTGDGVDSSIHSPTDGTQPSPANFTPSVETPESSKGSPTTPQSISHPKAPKVMVPIGESNRRIPPTSPSAPFVAPLKATELTIAGAVNDVIIRPQSALW